MLKFIKTKKLITTLGLAVCSSFGFAQSTIDWAKQIGGISNDLILDMKYRRIGTTDFIVTVGRFSGSVTFNPSTTLSTASGDTAMFVARFDVSGNCVWATSAGNANVSVIASSVDVANDGSILVAGSFRGASGSTVDFNPSAATTNLTCVGSNDIFVVKYTVAGALAWAFDLGGTGNEYVRDIAIDKTSGSTDASFYIAGSFSTLLRFDPDGGNTFRIVNSGTEDVFLGKYSFSTGAVEDVKTFGASGATLTSPIIKVNNTHVALTSSFNGTIDMDPGTGTTPTITHPTSSTSDLIALYTKNLDLVWALKQSFGVKNIEFNSTGDVCFIQDSPTVNRLSKVDGSSQFAAYVGWNRGNTTFGSYTFTLNSNDDYIIAGWYRATTTGTAIGELLGVPLPNLTFGTPNPLGVYVAMYSPTGGYLQGGASMSATTSTLTVQITGVQVKGTDELFVAGYTPVSNSFFWEGSATTIATTNSTANTFNGFLANYNLAPSCTTPTITAVDASRCGTGNITISTTVSAGEVRWYQTATSTSMLGISNSYSLPNLATTTTLYAKAVDGGCESARIPVTATINPVPSITNVTNNSRCGTGAVSLSAAASSGTTSLGWYTASSGGSSLGTVNSFTTPSISATTTFYVQANQGTCSSARTAVVATVTPIPTITSTTPGARCGTGTVTLSATSSAGSVNWYSTSGTLLSTGNSYTTPSISTNLTVNAEAVNGTCVSTSRTPVTASINTTPTVATTANSRCGSGSVTLSATPSAGTVNWYASNSGGSILGTGNTFNTPSISINTTYYAEAVNGCQSTRVAAIATINALPNVAVTTSGVVLTATETGATYQWVTCGSKNSYNPILIGITNGQSYNGSNGGVYAVFVTKNGCKDTSSCITLTVTGVEEESTIQNAAKIFPNPNNGEFSIELTMDSKVEIVDQTGRIVKTIQVEKGRPYMVDDLPKGLFILKSQASNKAILGKVLVSK